MKTSFRIPFSRLSLLAALLSQLAHPAVGQLTVITPIRGGGLDTNAPMIHVDVSYDATTRRLHAALDTSKTTPRLAPLPAGYAFDATSKYAVLSGKAYNFQYAWNPGSVFTPPPGAAVWIECLSASPGLEVYDGPGNKTENPARPYTPIFGTGGSSPRWQWYGRMAHNSYAILNPTTTRVSAAYRVYFGDAQTGAPDAYSSYGDAVVVLTWTIEPSALPGAVISSLTQQGTVATASFRGEPGKTFYLERSSALGPATTWQTVAGPLAGADGPQTLADPKASEAAAFYRLRTTVP